MTTELKTEKDVSEELKAFIEKQKSSGRELATCKSCGNEYWLLYDFATCLCGQQIFRRDFVSKASVDEGVYSYEEYRDAIAYNKKIRGVVQ